MWRRCLYAGDHPQGADRSDRATLSPKTENRKPKTENRKPKTENRKPKTENRNWKPETRYQKLKSEV
jgi:hypothetical protein